ncbi:MAG: HAMP domain-containing histidine kinase [Planctomycetes bacterium]|nr:HAMP domain-containing histidine kinase [Planctomycetota bacterium]
MVRSAAKPRARGPALLLVPGLLGCALAAVLGTVLWRTLDLELRAYRAELERAEVVAERLLRAATGSAAVFAQLPAESQARARGEAVEVEAAVGWLEPAPNPLDDDLVVADRLDRAARAEFGARDVAAAVREFDELLAAPLPTAQRLQVVAAAAWQAQRAGDAERLAALVRELDERLPELGPADLGRPALARTLAAALRLPRPFPAPWLARLVPPLPDGLLAGADVPAELLAAQRAVLARRALLQRLAGGWSRRSGRGDAGLEVAGPGELLAWRTEADGARRVALVAAPVWLEALRAAGRAGTLPAWPWLVEPEFGPDPAPGFGGVPFLRGVRPPGGDAPSTRPWLLPALAGGLLLAFGLATALQLRAARREAAAVRAQAEFLTTVTHELKTPLASIRLLGEMLAEGRARGREQDYYRMLAGEAARLSMLIENVLDLGRLERGERAYDLRVLDVGEVVRETVALFSPAGDGPTVRGPAAGLTSRLDRGAFVQALVAVLDNARKYGAPPIEVEIAPADGGERVLVRVRDHGPGVPAAERERVFERFVRGLAPRHGSTPGVGIGLYLARTIARRLGGELACGDPLDGQPGALFTFTLPREPA